MRRSAAKTSSPISDDILLDQPLGRTPLSKVVIWVCGNGEAPPTAVASGRLMSCDVEQTVNRFPSNPVLGASRADRAFETPRRRRLGQSVDEVPCRRHGAAVSDRVGCPPSSS